jgi:hypothetical protein
VGGRRELVVLIPILHGALSSWSPHPNKVPFL